MHTCVICADEAPAADLHWLACGHGFHTDCIVDWFRRGKQTCPLCRDDTVIPETPVDRERMLRQFARRRTAPKELHGIVKKVQALEHRRREVYRQRVELRAKHQSIFMEHCRLDRKCNAVVREEESARAELRRFVHPDVPIPLLYAAESDSDSE